jgi:hypothetical protein
MRALASVKKRGLFIFSRRTRPVEAAGAPLWNSYLEIAIRIIKVLGMTVVENLQ